MSPEERQQRHDEQTKELYAGLGEFVACFELLVFWGLRLQLINLWSGNSRDLQKLVQPAVADLTADPILKIYQATYSTAIQQSGLSQEEKVEGEKILADVCKDVRDLIKTRNEIVHGTWHIGWASSEDTDFSVAGGVKPTNTKSGVEHRNISRTRAGFDKHIDECRRLRDLLMRVGVVVQMERPFSTNFCWLNKKASLDPAHWTFKPLVK